MINLLAPHWLSRLEQYTQLIVGFSGGLDSTVLLHLLASVPALHPKLVAVHVNHGISANALAWQKHAEQFCLHLKVPFITRSVTINKNANVEEEARKARYAVFASLIASDTCLLLGHHLDDQAETVLLQLFRGAGVDGLAAMQEWMGYESGYLARPFLSCSRKQLEHYALQHQLAFVEDESNQDVHYARNYLRHQIIPLITQQWPGAVGTIARTAAHCQQAKTNLDALALLDSKPLITKEGALFVAPLKDLNKERISNVLRFWLKSHAVSLPSTLTFQRLIDEVLWACEDAMPLVSWGDFEVRRYRDCFYINKVQKAVTFATPWSHFPEPLILIENAVSLTAKKATSGMSIPKHSKITVRSRRGGEVFVWHGKKKRLKKLLQEWDIPPWLRDKVPLLYINEELAVVVGYAVSDTFFSKDEEAWVVTSSLDGT